MMARRDLVTGSVLLGALASPAPAAAAEVQVDVQSTERIVKALAELRDAVHDQREFAELIPLRQAQKQYLRVNGKLPDYLEVGADVWFNAHDWHVRWQQPLAVGRDLQGRSTIMLNQTTIIMRTDVANSFVGLPYDNR